MIRILLRTNDGLIRCQAYFSLILSLYGVWDLKCSIVYKIVKNHIIHPILGEKNKPKKFERVRFAFRQTKLKITSKCQKW